MDSKLNKHDWRSALKLTNGTLNHPPYFEKEREYGMNVAGRYNWFIILTLYHIFWEMRKIKLILGSDAEIYIKNQKYL